MLKKLRQKLPKQVWSALVTASAAFGGVFVPLLLLWLQNLGNAVSHGTPLPSISILAAAVIAGFSAAMAGLINFTVRQIQVHFKIGSPPDYHDPAPKPVDPVVTDPPLVVPPVEDPIVMPPVPDPVIPPAEPPVNPDDDWSLDNLEEGVVFEQPTDPTE